MAKKYISNFVIKQMMLNSRLRMRLLWDSSQWGTYVKAKHGKLI
jgi:hypothetical protein